MAVARLRAAYQSLTDGSDASVEDTRASHASVEDTRELLARMRGHASG